MDPSSWPDEPNRSKIGSFYSLLLTQERHEINRFPLQDYPTWARRVVHAERKRYKDKGTDKPTKADRKMVLDFGEGISSQLSQPNDNQQASVDSNQQPSVKEKKKKKKKKKKEKGPGQGEYDAEYLHTHVADEAAYPIVYSKNCRQSHERTMKSWGHFICKTEECEENEWKSAIIACHLIFSRSNISYKVTLHAQKCRQCERYAEPIVDPEAYARQVVHVLDLWMHLREREEPTGSGVHTRGPHDIARCHGCEVGQCPYSAGELGARPSRQFL
ncbi:hypothetical protein BX616_003049 [Lobosporangium transversale]|uniref:3CxxC-type domain-containing protein n=1 Tax=Lobosporangium transversale TaxID=64571 RepID=A0A1Y2GEV5_9FUNG|nr:hypothetical protein BCR41DRAFT_424790 [Lobosporangium transversale]KAF9899418.1 hypothetical protein BX616_003049 [Lobosporangium transversale]ORZ07532.1 hypothetical protein BCR41DRAFT_424790 [Lobosporangium transversale]|eukprot:XP_021878039.1 hypothetical protein BCR41DRAFT_424790 [Lobosporangium transversale]